MSASHGRRPPGADAELRELLGHLEARSTRMSAAGEGGVRHGEQLSARELEELRRAWHRYCEVIAELGDTAADSGPPPRS
jgi:hypothetical protein